MVRILKKFGLVLILWVSFWFMGYSQIKVSENGNVGIKYDNIPLSGLVYNHEGHSDFEAYFYAPTKLFGGTLYLKSERSTGSHVSSLYAYTYAGYGYNYGVKGYAISANPASGRTYGVYAMAGNGSSGWNYAVYGKLYGSNNGAGIFGANNTKGDCSVPGKYAGYFRGDVRVEDLLWAYQITESDIKFKENIEELDEKVSISKLKAIRPVEYNIKQRYVSNSLDLESDSTLVVNYFEENSQLLVKKKFGLIAQELRQVYPDLVYEDQNGDLGIDYTGLIPILIKTIQTQQVQLEAIEEEIKKLKAIPNEIRY